MTTKTVGQVAKITPDITQEQIERLKQLFPECVSEGKVDFDRLRATLGDAGVLAGDNAYTFTWAGKQDAFRAIQTPSGASLAPAPDESVNWEETRHLFIEGENLEVLKLLYKSYFGKVKMIYIDPPYNTGNDFIYRDDYSKPRRTYLEKTGQMDAEGNLLTTNPETSGRYHSDWLLMMYPRLFLARQLLREDGVIFVSIDDNEVHNLRLMMNEVFGEENLVAEIIWKKAYGGGAKVKQVVGLHEYVICFARNKEALGFLELPPNPETRKYYKYTDEKFQTRGPYRTQPLWTNSMDPRPNLRYSIMWNGQEIWPERQWQWQKSRTEEALENDELVFVEGEDGYSVYYKQYLRDETGKERGAKPYSVLEGPYTQDGTAEITNLFGNGKIFPFPKPPDLIKHFVSYTWTDEDAIILDFFAGSCSTAQAVLEFNREQGGNRQFILVQFPELTADDSPAHRAGFETIADIGKERIRRVIVRMQDKDDDGQLSLDLNPNEDLGFKVFKLAPSTFRQWEPPADEGAEDAQALEKQLALFDRGLEPGADPRHVIYEVILKLGYSLNAQIAPLELESNQVYRVTDAGDSPTTFYICLDDDLQDATIDALPLDKDVAFVCLDTALDDSQKVNLSMQCLLKVI